MQDTSDNLSERRVNMKRSIPVTIFSILLLFSMFVTIVPGDTDRVLALTPVKFKDVASGYWGRPYIEFASASGIIKGYAHKDGSVQFKPENPVSCEEAMQMIMQSVKNSGIGPAPDVPLTRKYEQHLIDNKIAPWAYECVSYGLEFGILLQEELAGFRTESGIAVNATREQVARWTAKALTPYPMSAKPLTFAGSNPYMPATALTFLDKDKINPENRIYIDLLRRMSVMVGDSSNRFYPGQGIRRVEFAVICTKVYDLSGKPYEAGREIADYQGTITGVNEASDQIYLTMNDGSARVIDLSDNVEIVYNGLAAYNSLESIESGRDAIIAWGPFGQIHITTELFQGKGKVDDVSSVSGAYSKLGIRTGNGAVVYYFIDGETSILDIPKVGQSVTFISDGVKILEIQ